MIITHPFAPPGRRQQAYLSTVLRDEVVFLHRLFDEDSPSCHIRRRQQQMLKYTRQFSDVKMVKNLQIGENQKTERIRFRWKRLTKHQGVAIYCCPVPFLLLSGWSSSCRTRSCCPSDLQRRRLGTGQGHTPSLPGSRDTAWCYTELCIDILGNGSDLWVSGRVNAA